MNSRTSALCAALLLSLPACLSAQEVRVLDGGGLRVEDGGGITAEGEVRVAGADNPTLTLAGGSTLRLAPGTLLSVGDGTDPGTLSASGTPAPAITTSGIPGTDFYSFSVASTGTLAVTALALTSPDMGGITLASGSTLAGGALSGAAFDYVQNGGTYLRFLHTAGSFAVSGCTFNNSGAVALFNISSPLGTVPATLLVNAYTNNGGARAGSPYEDDHGSGTDIAAATSTIRWFDEGTPPTLLTPVSWAALYDNTPDFDWSDVTNAAGYELAVDNNWTFASPEIGVSVVPSAAPDQGPPLAENTYFYWRVRAVDPVGQYGPWAPAIGFQMDPPPVLLSPTDGTTTKDSTPTLDWTDEVGAAGYDIQVANNTLGDFTTPLIDLLNAPPPSEYTPAVLPDGGYSWRARSVDALGNRSAWAPYRTFTVDTTVPSLLTPPSSSSVSGVGGVYFDWTAVNGAVEYRFQLATDAGFSSIIIDVTMAGTDYTSPQLAIGTYYWRVFAVDAAGFQLATAGSSFSATGSGIGSISVVLGANNPPASDQLKTAQNLSMVQLKFSSAPTEDVQITSITITGLGTGDDAANIQGVRLYLDVNGNGLLEGGTDTLLGGPLAYSADNGTVTFGGLTQVVPAGQSRNLIVVYDLNGTAAIGSTFRARLAVSTNVSAVGMTSGQALLPSGPYPLDGGLVTVVASGTGSLTMTEGTASPADSFVLATEQTVEMVQIQLNASSVENIQVTGLIVHGSGTGNEAAAISNVFLAQDVNGNGIFNAGVDSVIAVGNYGADNGTVSFAFFRTIAAGTAQQWLVVYDLNGTASAGQTFTVEIQPGTAGDVTASGATSGNPIAPLGASFFGALQTIGAAGSPGSVTISNVSLPTPDPVPAFAHDVLMLAFEINVSGIEDMVIQEVRVKSSGSGNEAAHLSRAKLWEDADGNGQFSAADLEIASLTPPFGVDDGQAVFVPARTVSAGQTRIWFLTYDLIGSSTAGATFQASFDLGGSPVPVVAVGVTSNQYVTPSGGIIMGPQVGVQPLVGSSGEEASKCLGSVTGATGWGAGLAALLVALLAILRRRSAMTLVLLLAAAAAAGAQERLPVDNWPPVEEAEELRPGFDPLHLVPQRPLPNSPLRVSSNSVLHSLFGFLPLESAEPIEEGRVHIGLYEDVSSGGRIEIATPDYFFRYEAVLLETNLDVRFGFFGDWEVRVGADLSNLLEETDDIILARGGDILIREGERSTGVGDLRLAAKKRILSIGDDGALGVAVGIKIPLSRGKDDLLTSGNVDFAASVLFSYDVGSFTFHANLGAIIPGDMETFEEDVDTRNAIAFGAAVIYRITEWALVAVQLQGNQSVFSDSEGSVAIFDETVVTVHGGGRVRVGSYFLEASVGTGFGEWSSGLVVTVGFVVPL